MSFEIYSLQWHDEEKFPVTVELVGLLSSIWYCTDGIKPSDQIISVTDFENSEHRLWAVRSDFKKGDIKACPDFSETKRGFWAISDRHWDWIPKWQAAGCRVAENVKAPGKRRFKLLFPTQVLDLIDDRNTRFRPTMNGRTPEDRRPKTCVFELKEKPPYVFRMLRRENDPNFLADGPVDPAITNTCYVNEDFVADCEARGIESCQFGIVFQAPRQT